MSVKNATISSVIICFLVLMMSQQVFADTERTESSETVCENGRCNVIMYSYQKFFQDNGTWKEVKENWTTTGCLQGYSYCVTGNPAYEAHVKSDLLQKEPILVIKRGEKIVSAPTQLVDDLGLTQSLIFSRPTVSGNQLTFNAPRLNIDFILTYHPSTLRKEIVLKTKSAAIRGNLTLIEKVNSSLSYEKNQRTNRDISLRSFGGEEIARFLAPFFGNYQEAGIFFDVGETTIKTVIEYDKLKFPVIIDPTTDLNFNQIIQDGWLAKQYSSPALFQENRVQKVLRIGHRELADGINQEIVAIVDVNLTILPTEITIVNASAGFIADNIDDDNDDLNVTLIGFHGWQVTPLWGNAEFNDVMDNTVGSIDNLLVNRQFNVTLNRTGIDRVQSEYDTDPDKAFSFGLRNSMIDLGNDSPDSNETQLSSEDHATAARRPHFYVTYGWRPRYYNESVNPASPQNFSDNITLRFNITVTFPNGAITNVSRVFLNINGSNISATNLFGNIYNVSITNSTIRTNGNYTYCWFMNETGFGLSNSTPCQVYVVGAGEEKDDYWKVALAIILTSNTLSMFMVGRFFHAEQSKIQMLFFSLGAVYILIGVSVGAILATGTEEKLISSTNMMIWMGLIFGLVLLVLMMPVKSIIENWRKNE